MNEERCEWHVLVDRMAEDNASAVLMVARTLVREARRRGVRAGLVAGVDQFDGFPDGEGVLRPEPSGPAHRAIDAAAKCLVGRPFRGTRRLEPGRRRSDPTHVYLHNQPWLAPAFRRAFPHAELHLYAHNLLLNRVPRAAVRRLATQWDGVVGVSGYVTDDLATRCGLDRRRMRVVHSGVDTDRFDSAAPGAADVDVVFAGRMVADKGVHVLLDALTAVRAQGLAVTAEVAGAALLHDGADSGAYAQRMRATAAARVLDVRFRGLLAPGEVPALLDRARIVVVPSVWPEPLGLVALEGLASRAALVASRVGGLPEVVGDGALLVPPDDPPALARALADLLTDEPRRIRLAARGRAVARDRSWSRAYDELTAIDAESRRTA